jgi:hypothetical protein
LKNLDPIRTELYVRRSNSFFEAMRLLRESLPAERLSTDAAVALLAVHGSISLSDAIQMALLGARSKAEDHRAAVVGLEGVCGQHRMKETQGVGHLKWLVGKKPDIAYLDKRFAHCDAALDHAEKFYRWAYNHFREVLLVQDRA